MGSIDLLQDAARKTAGVLGRETWLIRKLRPVYENFMDRLSGGRGIPWAINGITYRIDPHYRHQLGQLYDPTVAEFLRERVRPGAVCLDVGANVGVYVLQFARWTRPNGRVFAFEPNPAALDVLRKHIRMNGLTERVEVIPFAVGATAGKATLYAAAADGMSRLGKPNAAIEERVHPIKVPVVTLDDYCQQHGLLPDWLLMDIEGFEFKALHGARQLIKGRRSLGIIVEIHPTLWASAETTRSLAEETLAELGLHPEPLTGQTDPLGEYGLVHLAHV